MGCVTSSPDRRFLADFLEKASLTRGKWKKQTSPSFSLSTTNAPRKTTSRRHFVPACSDFPCIRVFLSAFTGVRTCATQYALYGKNHVVARLPRRPSGLVRRDTLVSVGPYEDPVSNTRGTMHVCVRIPRRRLIATVATRCRPSAPRPWTLQTLLASRPDARFSLCVARGAASSSPSSSLSSSTLASSSTDGQSSLSTATPFAAATKATGFARASRAALTLTENARRRLEELKGEHPDALGVRVCVKTRGCTGQAYALEWATDRRPLDEEIVDHGLRVFIDAKALLSIVGTQMDFVDEPLRSEFVFRNPNVKGMCGCGESFYL
jgi:iron-sulfur cluster assembly accessory protein